MWYATDDMLQDPADRAAVEEALAGQNLIKRAPGKMPSKNLLHSFSRRHAGALIQAAGGVGRVGKRSISNDFLPFSDSDNLSLDGFVDALLKRAVENGGISANALASLEGSDLAAIQDAASRSGQSVDELTAGIIKRGLSSNVLVDHLLK